jgi:TatD DNase family protein
MVTEAGKSGVAGVLHCYTGSHALAEAAIDAGWYISFSGIVTFRKWTDDELIRMVPRDRLLAESDAPYLAPVPHRGRRNEPSLVAHTLARIAETRGEDVPGVAAVTADNARRLFKLA